MAEQTQLSDDEVAHILAPSGRLRAGINMSNFLLVSDRTDSGDPAGLSPSLAQHIATKLGLELELIPFESPGELADAVTQDKWDIANIAVEAERAAIIAFSKPYIHIDANFMVRSGSSVQTNQDVNNAAVEIVLYGRSAYDLWLTENYTHPQFLRAASIPQSHELFYEGQGDVLASLKPRLVEEMKTHPGYQIITPAFTAIKQAVGVAKHRQDILPALNKLIDEALAEGMIKQLLDQFKVADKLSLPG